MKTIYWAVLLDDDSKLKLIDKVIPLHNNIYAEHMTVVFSPSDHVELNMMERLGQHIMLSVSGVKSDERGQAVVVTPERRVGGGIPHITISCADKTKPFYSNKLLDGGWDSIETFLISGTISRFTSGGWIKSR